MRWTFGFGVQSRCLLVEEGCCLDVLTNVSKSLFESGMSVAVEPTYSNKRTWAVYAFELVEITEVLYVSKAHPL